jgi:hypothetical protein
MLALPPWMLPSYALDVGFLNDLNAGPLDAAHLMH